MRPFTHYFFFESARVPMFACSADGRIEACNPAWLKRFDVNSENSLRRRLSDFVAARSQEELKNLLAARPRKSGEIDLYFTSPDKGDFLLRSRYGWQNHEKEEIIYFICNDPELDARLAMLERLHRSEARTRAILETFPDLIFVLSRSGTYIEVYAGNPKKLVRPAEELMGRRLSEFLPDDVAKLCLSAIATCIDEGRPSAFEYSLSLPEGVSYFEARSVPLEDNAMFLVRDVTTVKETERQIRSQQAMLASSSRLAALGEMAGGIAHEINNPLTIIHYNALNIKKAAMVKDVKSEEIIRAADKIETTALRISHIVAGLRAIARDGTHDNFEFNHVKILVQDTLDLFAQKLQHLNIELRADELPDVALQCRPTQVCQILVNLFTNAQHAVEKLDSERWIRLRIVDDGAWIEFRISDSGPGVPLDLADRIFDPFFTTKEPGKGLGLGLSVSSSLSKGHGGQLLLDTKSEHTTFVLRLPKLQRSDQL